MKRKKVLALLGLLGADDIRDDGGDWVKCSCPFAPYRHSNGTDRNPSFGIEVAQRSRYFCFSCKASGPLTLLVTNLIMYRGEDNVKARRFVSQNEDLSIGNYEDEYKPEEPITLMPEGIKERFEPITNQLIRMVHKRKLTPEIIKRWEIMWDQKERRVIFPVRNDEGFLVGFRGRATYDEAYIKYRAYTELSNNRCDPKAHGVWFGQQFQPAEDGKIILVEGEMDAIALSRELTRHVAWASMGSAISTMQMQTIQAQKHPVVLFFDDDEAGWIARDKVIEKVKGVLPAALLQVNDYSLCNDPAELVENQRLRVALRSIAPVA